MAAERGQASVELIAGLPALIVTALVVVHLAATGYSQSLADGAAEAGALAVAAGTDPVAAAREALPEWAAGRARVERKGGGVRVALRPPALAPAIARALEVASTGWARPG